MLRGKLTLPRVLCVIAWLGVALMLVGTLLGAFGLELAEALRLSRQSRLAITFEGTNHQYMSFPWYLRLLTHVPADLAFAYALARLALLLGYAARGEVFSAPAAQHLRSFGVWMLLAAVADLLLPTIAQLLNVLGQPRGHFMIEFELDSADSWRLFFSTLIMLLARVLSDAYRLAEENRQFI